jgi:hypothetical protein
LKNLNTVLLKPAATMLINIKISIRAEVLQVSQNFET